MSKKITVEYFAESDYLKEPYQASKDAAGYELFAADTKTLLPKSVEYISLDLRTAIPSGFYGNVFPGSGIFKNHPVTCDAGVIDSNFKGKIYVLMINHHPEETLTVRPGDRIAQVVFMEKFNIDFKKVFLVESLGKTKRGKDGFGSTGVSDVKIFKPDSEEISKDSEDSVDNKLEIVSENAVMRVTGKIIANE